MIFDVFGHDEQPITVLKFCDFVRVREFLFGFLNLSKTLETPLEAMVLQQTRESFHHPMAVLDFAIARYHADATILRVEPDTLLVSPIHKEDALAPMFRC